MDNTAVAQTGQGNSGNFVSLAIAAGGGWIPPGGSGLFSSVLLGQLAGVTSQTIRRWVKTHKIPYRCAGDEWFIDPGDIARFVPIGNVEKE